MGKAEYFIPDSCDEKSEGALSEEISEESDEDSMKESGYVQLIPRKIVKSLNEVVKEKRIKHKRVRSSNHTSFRRLDS